MKTSPEFTFNRVINPQTRCRDINSFERDLLKALALLAMVFDHLLLYSDWVTQDSIFWGPLSAAGRWAFPIFAALCAFSTLQMKNENSLWRLAKRLFFWALIAQAVMQTSAYLHTGISKPILFNVLFSFLFSLAPILLLNELKSAYNAKFNVARIGLAATLCGLALVFVPHTEYGWLGFLCGPFACFLWLVLSPIIKNVPESVFFLTLSTGLMILHNETPGTAYFLPIVLGFFFYLKLTAGTYPQGSRRIFSRNFLYGFYALHTLAIALL